MDSLNGFSQEVRDWIKAKGISIDALLRCGVRGEGEWLQYPQHDFRSGKFIGWKYRNTVDKRTLYKWTKTEVPAPMMSAGSSGRLLLCEGESDFLRLVSCNSGDGVLCIPGSNGWKKEWLELVWSYGQVYLIADNDDAGRRLAQTVSSNIPKLRVCFPEAGDVCDEFTSEYSDSYQLEKLIGESIRIMPAKAHQSSSKRIVQYMRGASQVGIVDVILRLTRNVVLTKTYEGYKCKCVLHEDKTASLHINEKKGVFHCFGCGKGGDAYTFVMEYMGYNFPEAKQYLVEKGLIDEDR